MKLLGNLALICAVAQVRCPLDAIIFAAYCASRNILVREFSMAESPKPDSTAQMHEHLSTMEKTIATMRNVLKSGPMGQAPLKAGDDAWQKYHGSMAAATDLKV